MLINGHVFCVLGLCKVSYCIWTRGNLSLMLVKLQKGLTFSREPTCKMDYLCSATAVLSKGTTVPYHHIQHRSPFRRIVMSLVESPSLRSLGCILTRVVAWGL